MKRYIVTDRGNASQACIEATSSFQAAKRFLAEHKGAFHVAFVYRKDGPGWLRYSYHSWSGESPSLRLRVPDSDPPDVASEFRRWADSPDECRWERYLTLGEALARVECESASDDRPWTFVDWLPGERQLRTTRLPEAILSVFDTQSKLQQWIDRDGEDAYLDPMDAVSHPHPITRTR